MKKYIIQVKYHSSLYFCIELVQLFNKIFSKAHRLSDAAQVIFSFLDRDNFITSTAKLSVSGKYFSFSCTP